MEQSPSECSSGENVTAPKSFSQTPDTFVCSPLKHRKSYTGKTFFCSFCPYICTQKGHLIVHLRTHTGERPYECKYCSNSFACVSTIIGHLRTHTREKPYKCPLCDKRYAQKTPLTFHLRKHNNIRPYACRHCGKSFDRNSSLGLHLKKLHNSQPYYCDLCKNEFAMKFQLTTHPCPAMTQPTLTCPKLPSNGDTSQGQANEKSVTVHQLQPQHSPLPKVKKDEKPFKCASGKCKRAFSFRCHLEKHRCLYGDAEQPIKEPVLIKNELTNFSQSPLCDKGTATTVKEVLLAKVKPKTKLLENLKLPKVNDTTKNILNFEEKVNFKQEPHTFMSSITTDLSESSSNLSAISFINEYFQSAEIFQQINCSQPTDDHHFPPIQISMFKDSIPFDPSEQHHQKQNQFQQTIKSDPGENDDDDEMKQVIETLVQYLPLEDPPTSNANIPSLLNDCCVELPKDKFSLDAASSTSTTIVALPSFATLAPMAISASTHFGQLH